MHSLQYLTLAFVVASACYVVLTVAATARFARSHPGAGHERANAISMGQTLADASCSDYTPPVTLLKPVCGGDAEAEENFRSFLNQDYPAFQVVFGALDENDPALEVARRFLNVEIVANPRTIGANFKVSNLHNMMEQARHDILVIADSDMRVTPDYLRQIIAPFADEEVGLVTCPYRGAMPRAATHWQRLVIALHALGITADFMPGVMVAHMFGMRGFALGSTIAIRRNVLEQIGGFEGLKDHLADDYQLGRRVQRLGRKVVLSHYVVDNVLSPESFRDMFARRLRWARTVKVCQPAGYFGSFVTNLLPLTTIHLIASRGDALAWQTLGGALLLRLITVLTNNSACGRDGIVARYWWLTPVNDGLSFVVWCWSLLPGAIVWRGQRFWLTREGALSPIAHTQTRPH